MENNSKLTPKGYSSSKTQNSKLPDKVRLSQRAIVETAADLFARQGFGATSLDDIGRALGVTKGALYYHVKDKEEILRLIFNTVLTVSEEPLRRIAEAELDPVEKLSRAIAHHVAVAADRSPAMTVFYREDVHLNGPLSRDVAASKKAYERLFEQIVIEGQAKGCFKPDLDPKIVTFGILGMCNWLSQWYRAGGTYTPTQIAGMFSHILVGGLQKPN